VTAARFRVDQCVGHRALEQRQHVVDGPEPYRLGPVAAPPAASDGGSWRVHLVRRPENRAREVVDRTREASGASVSPAWLARKE